MKQLIFAVVIILLAVVFALQNAALVTVNLFLWNFSLSLALLIILVLAMGILIGILMMSKKVYNKHSQLKSLQKQNTKNAESTKV